MSKAFDTVNRQKLFEALDEILNPDELHLLSIITNNPKLKVKINSTFSNIFHTLIGIMQGDCLSAILLIFYLAIALRKEKLNNTDENNNNHFQIEPKYADDITYASTNEEDINIITNTIPTKLKLFDLSINTSKTEYFIIPRPQPPQPPPPTIEELILHQNDKILWSDLDWVTNFDKTPKNNRADWKQCKLLRSQLDTQNDINRKKKITIDAMKTLQYIIFQIQKHLYQFKSQNFHRLHM